ncbi:MAG: peptidoglycan D,D-transpeptidase FtsI family protein [Prochlorotrichaceae cyanobacterium]
MVSFRRQRPGSPSSQAKAKPSPRPRGNFNATAKSRDPVVPAPVTSPPSLSQKRRRRRSLWAKVRQNLPHPQMPALSVSLPLNISFRLWLVWGTLVLGICGLSYRLYQLQVVQVVNEVNLAEAAEFQHSLTLTPLIPRRPIVDRLGNVLAVDQTLYTLYTHPDLFSKTPLEVAVDLSAILEQSPDQILQEMGTTGTGIILSRDLTQDQADRILDLTLDGIDLVPHQRRLYPSADLFSQILGFVDVNGQERTGLEEAYAPQIKRSLPESQVERMGNGLLLPDLVPEQLVHPDNLSLKLTLDSRLQRAVTDSLTAQMKKFSAKRGAVFVMDVRDGSILSLVTLPSYNPNHYYDADIALFRNWAVNDLYEPGSTFKPINVAIALENQSIQPTDTIYDEGQIQRGGWPIQNHDYNSVGAGGTLSISEVLQRSSNVGMVHIMEQVPPQTYYEWLERLEIGQPVNTDLPLATPGQLRDKNLFMESVVDRATMAFGQGVSLTPLQMAQLLGTLANGGRWIRPHVVEGLADSDGTLQWQPDSPPGKQLFSPETSHVVLSMMRDVVNVGTAKVVSIPEYDIGGKTGTAQKAENGVYIDNARITSFVGILPIANPQYLVFAVIDEPTGEDAYGSTVAAPIVRQVFSVLINLYNIPPSAKPEKVE